MISPLKSARRLFCALAASTFITTASGTALAQSVPALLPMPKHIQLGKGAFLLDRSTVLQVETGDKGAHLAAQRLRELLAANGKPLLRITDRAAKHSIKFIRTASMAKEAYRLTIRPDDIVITASDDAGLFYGAISLWQLATQDTLPDQKITKIGTVTVEDAPRFAWRGLMLDSARHYQSPTFIKQFIDWMAAHKLNIFHWHLVDDQGWRIEIKKYPKLTEIGAWRIPATAPGAPALPRTGGYYTQAEIRDIVAYAAARHITIVPEIEMPGHALAPIRAYPELGTGIVPEAGIESDWGVFPYLFNIEDKSFTFLEDVLAETMALFPSTYIHVGGDEAVKDQWRQSPKIQAQMKSLGIADEKALQSWFIHRIETYLNKHGRRLIGWDEILEGGLAPNATVMSWRGIDGAIAAAKAGHDAVLSPDPILYLNHRQGMTSDEPPGRGNLISLAQVYNFNPSPENLTKEQQRHILGLQGNLWTEHMRTEERVAYMAYPRASALAEIAWSNPAFLDGKRNIKAFSSRLVPQLHRLKSLGLNASDAAFIPRATSELDSKTGKVALRLSSEIGADIRYTLDGTQPIATSPKYNQEISLTLPNRVRAMTFNGATPFPGEYDKRFDQGSVRYRDHAQLKQCRDDLVLQLEDDYPATGKRASFLINILKPCWIYEAAPLDGVKSVSVTVSQIPFNFQIGKDKDAIRFRPPATPEGEVELRTGGCEGDILAILPLKDAVGNPGLTTLTAPIAQQKSNKDICITYTAKGPTSLWAVQSVQLVTQ